MKIEDIDFDYDYWVEDYDEDYWEEDYEDYENYNPFGNTEEDF